jgi:transglutaminase-like putative cysteine protease
VRRRLLGAAIPVAAVTYAWASLEYSPTRLVFVAVAGATLLAAVPVGLRSRTAVAGCVLVGLTLVLAGSAPRAMRDVADQGLRDFYSVVLPFDPLAHHQMHVLVVLGAAVFGLAIAVTAGTRPFVAAALAVGGVGWPATILSARNTLAMGALALLAALWPVVVAGVRDRRGLVPGAAVLACVVVVATVAAGAGARPSTAALGWESWDLFGDSRAGNTVSLVWNSNYGGIDFPAKETTVLRIVAPGRALYWRATTLDTFAGDRWVETLYGTALSGATRTLPQDELLPAGASARRGWVKQEVEVRALVDDHVIAAGQPMEIAAGSDQQIRYLSGGIMRALGGLGQMRRYTVWSYAPRPTPVTLVRSRPVYPPALARYLDIGRTIVPPFGALDRTAAISAIFGNDLYQQMWPYEATWREARRLTAKADSPYEATIAIERWLRADGGFTYDEHPPAPVGPPLADFLERTKRGYCQQFAGTMALMLRYLGIPARVAVGFTSGTWKDGTWTVTDHDAHAWVEAWFAGHGWLAFDPTPGRGRLSASYTNASDSADAIRALGTGRFLDLGARARTTPARGVAPEEQSGGTSVDWRLIAPFGALVAALIGLAIMKSPRRYRGHATDDPRRRAAAARAELAAFIRDQGSPVSGTASVAELVVELRSLGVGSDAFAAAFARARYGPPADAAGAAEDTRRELRRVLSILRARLGPGRRIRGFFALRSLRAPKPWTPG